MQKVSLVHDTPLRNIGVDDVVVPWTTLHPDPPHCSMSSVSPDTMESPTATQKFVLTHETEAREESVELATVGMVRADQEAPFHSSAVAAPAPLPTAMQKSDLTHDTLASPAV
jgi:hypothetical protein